MLGRTFRGIIIAAFVLLVGSGWGVARANGQGLPAPSPSPTKPTSSAAKPSPLQVQFGLGNAWKLGHLVPVRVEIASALRAQASSIEIESIDGDGVELFYSQPLTPQTLSPEGVVWLPIRIGRQATDLEVRLLGPDGVVHRETFATETDSQVLPSAQPLVIALGSAMGISELSRSSADGSSSTFTTTVLTRSGELPLSWNAYSSCDVLIISGDDVPLLKELSAAQWTAIDDWIRRGGACIIALGEEIEQLTDLSPLTQLLPGKVVGTGRITNPAPLESLVATDQPLSTFACSLLEPTRGRIELTLTDSLARPVPWWLTYSHGLGTARFIASDLGSPAFDNWQDRQRLWGRLIAPYLDRGVTEAFDEKQVGASSYLGYGDLIGQLRATLDIFPEVRVISFGQVAAMLVAVLLLIGPIDYLISVKWLRRPDFSWYFAGGTLLLISLGLTWLLAVIRPTEVHVNAAQVIDVDAATGQAQGRLWSHVFSGSARELDITVTVPTAQVPVRVDWQGLPGRGLGGLQSQLGTDRGMPTYTIAAEASGQTHLRGVGVPAAGTKGLVANWTQPVELTANSNLREIPGVDQLEGELANPLSVDLLDPVLFYHNWYYSLNSRIAAGQSVVISFDTIPKDISRRLNGRHTVDGNESTVKWDPSDRGSIDRLLELMMFYKSASGQSYTTLAHRFQPQMDYSNLLQTDRAILLGRLEQPWGQVAVSHHDESNAAQDLEVKQDLDRVWCRIAIPVQQNSNK